MFTPQNEQGVIVLFAERAAEVGWTFQRIETGFPDATLVRNGESWLVEFEYMASNFLQHGHDHRGCELIICWENDYPGCSIPIIALQDPNWVGVQVVKSDPNLRAIEYWQTKTQRLQQANDELTGVVASLENENKYLQSLINGDVAPAMMDSAESILRRIPMRHRGKVIELVDAVRSMSGGVASPADFQRAAGWNKSLTYLIWPIAESTGLIRLDDNGMYRAMEG